MLYYVFKKNYKCILQWTWGTDIFEPKKEHKSIPLQDLAPLQDIKTYESEHQ